MLRRLPYLVAVLLAAAALSYCTLASRIADGHLDIDQAELQARIAPRFPVHHCKIVIACLDLSNPAVTLQEGDDHLGFTADVKVTLGTRERTGRIGLAGRPRYAPNEGQLFIEDLQITTLELAGFPEEYAEFVKTRAVVAARQALQSHPVYTLDANTAKGALAKRAVRDVKVVNGKLRIAFVGSSD
ncbi:DUF1439 domain-containing protein [Roseateles sp. BYS78W]|uniref:DUF1439 domain-containing protein n=1 Tax=Pelomonas candidula TaxID=3299025 RepID=A0ABW7HCP7_9BURK